VGEGDGEKDREDRDGGELQQRRPPQGWNIHSTRLLDDDLPVHERVNRAVIGKGPRVREPDAHRVPGAMCPGVETAGLGCSVGDPVAVGEGDLGAGVTTSFPGLKVKFAMLTVFARLAVAS
jgi:hypothetical protein